jgi:RNA polymerase sigma-70 factor (ECF subfamily)
VAVVSVATFEHLVAEHQREVLRLCRTILRDEHLGADAAQETFLRLWRRLEDGREPDHSCAWLRRVAVTTSLDVARTRTNRARETVIQESLPDRRATSPSLGEAELRERFERALAELPDGQRTVFLLRHEGGLRLAEVAETLGIALATAKTQFARACLKLQEKLVDFRPEREIAP